MKGLRHELRWSLGALQGPGLGWNIAWKMYVDNLLSREIPLSAIDILRSYFIEIILTFSHHCIGRIKSLQQQNLIWCLSTEIIPLILIGLKKVETFSNVMLSDVIHGNDITIRYCTSIANCQWVFFDWVGYWSPYTSWAKKRLGWREDAQNWV